MVLRQVAGSEDLVDILKESEQTCKPNTSELVCVGRVVQSDCAFPPAYEANVDPSVRFVGILME